MLSHCNSVSVSRLIYSELQGRPHAKLSSAIRLRSSVQPRSDSVEATVVAQADDRVDFVSSKVSDRVILDLET